MLAFRRPFDREFPADAVLPLEIQMRLERLGLEEHLRETRRQLPANGEPDIKRRAGRF